MAPLRGPRHRQAGAAGDHARRRPQLQALLARPGVQLRHRPQPPGPRRRAGHGRRAARPDGAARRARRPHARGAPDVLLPRQHRPAQEAPPGRGASARPGRLPLPRRPRPGPLRRDLARPAHPRPFLLHRLRDPVPDGRDGGPGLVGDRHRVRDPARGRGARAPADRGAQAALQPPVAVPGEGPLHQAHPRALAAAVAGPPGARRRRRLPRPVRVEEERREVPGRAPRHLPRPAVLRPARARPVALAVRARRDGPLPLAVRRQCRPHVVRRRRAPPARHPAARPRRRRRDHQPADGRPRRRRAVRGGRTPSRSAGRVRPRRRAHPAAERADQVPRGRGRPP